MPSQRKHPPDGRRQKSSTVSSSSSSSWSSWLFKKNSRCSSSLSSFCDDDSTTDGKGNTDDDDNEKVADNASSLLLSPPTANVEVGSNSKSKSKLSLTWSAHPLLETAALSVDDRGSQALRFSHVFGLQDDDDDDEELTRRRSFLRSIFRALHARTHPTPLWIHDHPYDHDHDPPPWLVNDVSKEIRRRLRLPLQHYELSTSSSTSKFLEEEENVIPKEEDDDEDDELDETRLRDPKERKECNVRIIEEYENYLYHLTESELMEVLVLTDDLLTEDDRNDIQDACRRACVSVKEEEQRTEEVTRVPFRRFWENVVLPTHDCQERLPFLLAVVGGKIHKEEEKEEEEDEYTNDDAIRRLVAETDPPSADLLRKEILRRDPWLRSIVVNTNSSNNDNDNDNDNNNYSNENDKNDVLKQSFLRRLTVWELLETLKQTEVLLSENDRKAVTEILEEMMPTRNDQDQNQDKENDHPALTKGALTDLTVRKVQVSSLFQPVVQVVTVKKVKRLRYGVILTDGGDSDSDNNHNHNDNDNENNNEDEDEDEKKQSTPFMFLLAPHLNQLVEMGKLRKGTVVQLNEVTVTSSDGGGGGPLLLLWKVSVLRQESKFYGTIKKEDKNDIKDVCVAKILPIPNVMKYAKIEAKIETMDMKENYPIDEKEEDGDGGISSSSSSSADVDVDCKLELLPLPLLEDDHDHDHDHDNKLRDLEDLREISMEEWRRYDKEVEESEIGKRHNGKGIDYSAEMDYGDAVWRCYRAQRLWESGGGGGAGAGEVQKLTKLGHKLGPWIPSGFVSTLRLSENRANYGRIDGSEMLPYGRRSQGRFQHHFWPAHVFSGTGAVALGGLQQGHPYHRIVAARTLVARCVVATSLLDQESSESLSKFPIPQLLAWYHRYNVPLQLDGRCRLARCSVDQTFLLSFRKGLTPMDTTGWHNWDIGGTGMAKAGKTGPTNTDWSLCYGIADLDDVLHPLSFQSAGFFGRMRSARLRQGPIPVSVSLALRQNHRRHSRHSRRYRRGVEVRSIRNKHPSKEPKPDNRSDDDTSWSPSQSESESENARKRQRTPSKTKKDLKEEEEESLSPHDLFLFDRASDDHNDDSNDNDLFDFGADMEEGMSLNERDDDDNDFAEQNEAFVCPFLTLDQGSSSRVLRHTLGNNNGHDIDINVNVNVNDQHSLSMQMLRRHHGLMRGIFHDTRINMDTVRLTLYHVLTCSAYGSDSIEDDDDGRVDGGGGQMEMALDYLKLCSDTATFYPNKDAVHSAQAVLADLCRQVLCHAVAGDASRIANDLVRAQHRLLNQTGRCAATVRTKRLRRGVRNGGLYNPFLCTLGLATVAAVLDQRGAEYLANEIQWGVCVRDRDRDRVRDTNLTNKNTYPTNNNYQSRKLQRKGRNTPCDIMADLLRYAVEHYDTSTLNDLEQALTKATTVYFTWCIRNDNEEEESSPTTTTTTTTTKTTKTLVVDPLYHGWYLAASAGLAVLSGGHSWKYRCCTARAFRVLHRYTVLHQGSGGCGSNSSNSMAHHALAASFLEWNDAAVLVTCPEHRDATLLRRLVHAWHVLRSSSYSSDDWSPNVPTTREAQLSYQADYLERHVGNRQAWADMVRCLGPLSSSSSSWTHGREWWNLCFFVIDSHSEEGVSLSQSLQNVAQRLRRTTPTVIHQLQQHKSNGIGTGTAEEEGVADPLWTIDVDGGELKVDNHIDDEPDDDNNDDNNDNNNLTMISKAAEGTMWELVAFKVIVASHMYRHELEYPFVTDAVRWLALGVGGSYGADAGNDDSDSKDDCNVAFSCLLWLRSMGLNVVSILLGNQSMSHTESESSEQTKEDDDDDEEEEEL